MEGRGERCSIDECSEYYTTALQIFEYCSVEKDGTLHVDALMDKFEPFIKTNKSEYSHLKSMLDPELTNPLISVTMLSDALSKYSEGQKEKSELDESFNLRAGPVPQDSDSGISSDGFQLIEDLQCELREKARVANQLRNQLDFTDRQHEEAVATLTAERDSLRAHLNMLREENVALVHVRRDYEEVCDRLCNSETALDDARRQLDASKRRLATLAEQLAELDSDKLTLQELLNKSKDECHRINDMYATRQSVLIEQNESLRTECAELRTRLHDQEEVMQLIVKEKVQLEMELKDVFNKSNLHPRMNQSIDVSYTEDQMLTALDSLNSDSKFVNVSQDNTQADDFFTKPFKEEQGRMSLFDEIRLSFSCNSIKFKELDISRIATNETQTEFEHYYNNNNESPCNDCMYSNKSYSKLKSSAVKLESNETQTEFDHYHENNNVEITRDTMFSCCDTENSRSFTVNLQNNVTQTDFDIEHSSNKVETTCYSTFSCNEYENNDIYAIKTTETQTASNLYYDKKTEEIISNSMLYRFVCDQNKRKEDKRQCIGTQTERNLNEDAISCNISLEATNQKTSETQTEFDVSPYVSSNSKITSDCLFSCQNCDKKQSYVFKLERELKASKLVINDMHLELEGYETDLKLLRKMNDEDIDLNLTMNDSIQLLNSKLAYLEEAYRTQKDILDCMEARDVNTVETLSSESQTVIDSVTTSTQVHLPCVECEKRSTAVPDKKSWRKFAWTGLKSLFSIFATFCFIGALFFLYQVAHYHFASRRCIRETPAVPWRWLNVHDLLDFIFRIEYVGEVPM